jgi:hypothetical protein
MLTLDLLKEQTKIKKQQKLENPDNYINWDEFVLLCYNTRTPQSYGALIEKRIIKNNGFRKLKSELNIGDAEENGLNKEIKISISADDDQPTFNIVQIRPHADISSYLIWFIEIDKNCMILNHTYEVPKEDMMKIPGIGGAHGTKISNVNQKNVEYRVTVKKNSIAWKFLQSYLRKLKW